MPEVQPAPPRRRATWVASLVGVALLALLGLVSLVAEPYLIALAVPSTPSAEPRGSAGGWGNTTVWLAAEGTALVALFFIGFVTKWLSPRSSWLPPGVVLICCLVYFVFAQFPATRSTWRIIVWSLGSLVAIAAGAWLALRAVRGKRVA